MKITKVEASKAERKCGKCGAVIPVGGPYRWYQHRHSSKNIRCMSPKCSPRQSELARGRNAEVYAVQEGLEDELEALRENMTGHEDLVNSLETATSELEDLAQQYEDAISNMPDSLQQSPVAEDCQTKADSIRSWIDELGQAQSEIEQVTEPDGEQVTAEDEPEEPDEDDTVDKETNTARYDSWKEEHKEWEEAFDAWEEYQTDLNAALDTVESAISALDF